MSEGGQEEGPRQVGRYPLTRRLGEGGMGEVWLGHHPGLDLPVAVKLLRPRLAAQDPSFVRRFLQEGRTAARLSHPNVVRVFDADTDGDRHFLVMEYVEGGSVRDLLRREQGSLPLADALAITTRVAQGLVAAAKHDIVHRDIKPDNILLTRDGTPKLSDLGLAKARQDRDGESVTATGTSVGTPHYIAPEQAMDFRNADARSDIYSLGATLYHLCTGAPPFDGESSFAIMAQHLNESMPDPRQRRPDLPEEVCVLLRRMLEKEPGRRYQSAAELLADLQALSANRDVAPVTAPATPTSRPVAATHADAETADAVPTRGGARQSFGLLLRRTFALAIDVTLIGIAAELAGAREVAFWILLVLYAGVGVGWRGRTLGKWITGLRVVHWQGGRPSWSAAFLRAFGYLVSTLPLFVGFVWAVWDPDDETFHDKIARTRVVRS